MQTPTIDPRLLGKWIADSTHQLTLNNLGDVELDFRQDGQLIYTVKEQTFDKIINMTWIAKDGVVVTDQPSRPEVQQSPYYFDSTGKLFIRFDAEIFQFCRFEFPR